MAVPMDIAREYVHEASARHLSALTAASVAARAHVPERVALAMLEQLAEEGLVVARGHIECPDCHESVELESTTLAGMTAEAKRICEGSCPYCAHALPDPRDVRVRLSFPLAAMRDVALAAPHGSEPTPDPLPMAPAQSPDEAEPRLTLSQMKEVIALGKELKETMDTETKGVEPRYFAIGAVLLALAAGFAIWAFAKGDLTADQRQILVWALPLASGFGAGAFVGGLTVKSKGWIPGLIVAATGGFAVWFVTFIALFRK